MNCGRSWDKRTGRHLENIWYPVSGNITISTVKYTSSIVMSEYWLKHKSCMWFLSHEPGIILTFLRSFLARRM
jgi:hypothetical protein